MFITLVFKVEVLSSLQKPKKITANASDGKSYILLCKPKVFACSTYTYVHPVIESILLLSRTTLEKMHDWWNSTQWSTRFSIIAIFCIYIVCMWGCDMCTSLILLHLQWFNYCNTNNLYSVSENTQTAGSADSISEHMYVCTNQWNMSFVSFFLQAVIPLNEECGVLEWVTNTHGLRNILLKLYQYGSFCHNYIQWTE